MPRWSDSATFSAACRQMEQRRNIASPSTHSLEFLSKLRGVEATVKLTTAAPEGVKRSSGSSVRLPTTVMRVSPAMSSPCWSVRSWSGPGHDWVTTGSRSAPSLRRAPTEGSAHPQCVARGGAPDSVRVRPDDLGPEHGLVQRELAVELLDGVGLGVEVDHRVDALLVLLDLVCHAATSPDVDGLDGAAVLADDVEVLVERGLDSALFETGVEDDHYFVGTQSSSTSCGLGGHGLSVAGGLVRFMSPW